ncbi:unnamed protein product [Hymenolepis diminuta]|uniref:Uncharacterized protein n=1 Tax=Hymenolepis diminuta TaxID=6216 RepID=A0A0R3SMS0_HYMDI|nr:unnamed protein product [Hymenolepis diminuta]
MENSESQIESEEKPTEEEKINTCPIGTEKGEDTAAEGAKEDQPVGDDVKEEEEEKKEDEEVKDIAVPVGDTDKDIQFIHTSDGVDVVLKGKDITVVAYCRGEFSPSERSSIFEEFIKILDAMAQQNSPSSE